MNFICILTLAIIIPSALIWFLLKKNVDKEFRVLKIIHFICVFISSIGITGCGAFLLRGLYYYHINDDDLPVIMQYVIMILGSIIAVTPLIINILSLKKITKMPNSSIKSIFIIIQYVVFLFITFSMVFTSLISIVSTVSYYTDASAFTLELDTAIVVLFAIITHFCHKHLLAES